MNPRSLLCPREPASDPSYAPSEEKSLVPCQTRSLSTPLSALPAHLPLLCPTSVWRSLAPSRQLQRGPRVLSFTRCLCLFSSPLPSCPTTGSPAGVGMGVGAEKDRPPGRPPDPLTLRQQPAGPGSVQRLLPVALLAQRPLAHHTLS